MIVTSDLTVLIKFRKRKPSVWFHSPVFVVLDGLEQKEWNEWQLISGKNNSSVTKNAIVDFPKHFQVFPFVVPIRPKKPKISSE